MKIGIDARFYAKAGPGRYTKNIIKHLEKVDDENEYVIFLKKEDFDKYEPDNPKFTKVLADYSWYSFEEQTSFLFAILKQKLDLYYVPHFNMPALYPGKLVTAIPDMTMHTYSTEKGTTLPLWYFRLKMLVYKIVFWWAVFRSYKVIVPSKTVISEFLEHLNFKEDKYVLAYEGVDPDLLTKVENPDKVLDKYGIDREFVLSVGSMYEHKNVSGLIDMFKILQSEYGYKGQLVLASKRDKFSERVYDRVVAEGLEKDVRVLAFVDESAESDAVVSDEEVVALRQKATLYTMASFKEGFSLTALEGMAMGLPAALSDIDCHREVYGNSVVFYDPSKPQDMAWKINDLLNDVSLREDYIKRGYEQVKKYNWQKTAEITLDVFTQALKK